MRASRDRIQVEEAVQLASQIRLPVKVVYFDGWTLRNKPEKNDKVEFARRVHEQFQFDSNVTPADVYGLS